MGAASRQISDELEKAGISAAGAFEPAARAFTGSINQTREQLAETLGTATASLDASATNVSSAMETGAQRSIEHLNTGISQASTQIETSLGEPGSAWVSS